MKKRMDFCKKKQLEKTIRATGLKSESIMPITILHNRLDLWYGILHTFFNIYFLRSIFTHFYHIFDPLKSMGKILNFKILYF